MLPTPRSFPLPHHSTTEKQDEGEEDTVLGARSKSGAATLATPESFGLQTPNLDSQTYNTLACPTSGVENATASCNE